MFRMKEGISAMLSAVSDKMTADEENEMAEAFTRFLRGRGMFVTDRVQLACDVGSALELAVFNSTFIDANCDSGWTPEREVATNLVVCLTELQTLIKDSSKCQ